MQVIDRGRQRAAFFTRDAFATTARPTRIAARQTSSWAIAALTAPVRSASEAVRPIAPPDFKSQYIVGKKRSVALLVSEDACDTVRALAGTDAYVQARRRRQRIERVFDHLKRNLGMRTLKPRDFVGSAEEFAMAAVAYNLQLLAKQAVPSAMGEK